MIIRISNFENDIVINEDYVRVLEIEDRALFANIVQSINSLCYNQDSKEYIVLLENGKGLDFHKDVYFIFDILNIDFNERKVLNKLYSNIKLSLESDIEIRHKLETYFRDVFKLLDLALLELPFEFVYNTELKMENLFKLYGIRLYNESQSFMEKILYLIDLISLLNLCKVLILCNMKSFFTDNQVEEIYKYIIHNKLNVLLIEGVAREKPLNHEQKVRIDSSFDDYEI